MEANTKPPKLTTSQVLCGLAQGFRNFEFAAILGFTSKALVSLKQDPEIDISDEQVSWVGAATPLMALLGSLMGGRLIENFGRRKVSIFTSVPALIAWIFLFHSSSATEVIVVRFIHGLCLGIQQVASSVYVSEMVHPKLRPMLGIIPALAVTLGFFTMNVAGFYTDWRGLALVGGCLHFPLILTMIFLLPETPYYMLKNGKVKDCLQTLEWLKKDKAEAKKELEVLQKSVSSSDAEKNASLSTCFTKPYRWPIVFAICMHLFQQSSGFSAAMTFIGLIFSRGEAAIDPGTCSIINTFVNLITLVTVTRLYSRYPRKNFIKLSSFLMSLALLLLSGYFYLHRNYYSVFKSVKYLPYLPGVSYTLLTCGFCIGWAPLPWMFIADGLPLKIRGIGAGIITAFNWAANFFFTKSYSWAFLHFGDCGVFLIYGICIGMGGIIIGRVYPETFGFDDQQLENYYKNKYKASKKRNVD